MGAGGRFDRPCNECGISVAERPGEILCNCVEATEEFGRIK
jgi:hypothetical protein